MLCRAVFAFALLTQPAEACRTALLLAMDVSNSVDPSEYRLQVDGLASALRDPEIAEILVRDRIALSVMQWSGTEAQQISLGWTQMAGSRHVQLFASAVERMPRAFVMSNTAPGAALHVALDHLEASPDCARRVIDMSGDGTLNAGPNVAEMRLRAERMGVTVNGLAIESLGRAISNFYARHVITRGGFVETARGYSDYARAIRRKILREISAVFG
ncbi:DUF1194 domain-containing protein [Marivita sp. GX14005]|uniref:DUF1194 domain-containing protein n=1 Tax=Marivita sp. GX14005 TaxID=2942276 RepID=UPI002019B8AF|nr:DUF1194 domain-containing protein [Marivita sp. GX14005]MCL3882469.1 DUF1194 domain-containing protein [Marivita sp. GX14005]